MDPVGDVRRRVSVLAGLYLTLILVALVVVMPLAVRSRNADRVVSTRWAPAQVAIRELSASVLDQETGQRGFVITGDESFLGPYETGRRDSQRYVALLSSLLARHPASLASLERATASLARWELEAADPEIAAARTDRAAAAALVANGTGKRLFEAFRADLEQLQVGVDDRAAAERRVVSRSSSRLVIVIVSLVVVAVVAGIAVAIVFRRWAVIRERDARTVQRLASADAEDTRWRLAAGALAQRLTQADSVHEVARIAASHAATAIGAQFTTLAITDRDGQPMMTFDPRLAESVPEPPRIQRSHDYPVTVAIRERRTVVAGSLEGQEPISRFGEYVSLAATAGITTCVAAPLVEATGRALGAFSVTWSTPVAFDEVRTRFDTLVLLMTESVRRAKAVEVSRALADASHALNAADSLEDIGRIVTQEARRIFDATDACYVAEETTGARPSGGPADPDHPTSRSSRASIPISTGTEVVGAVELQWWQPTELTAFAGSLPVFVEAVTAAVSRVQRGRSVLAVADLARQLATVSDVAGAAKAVCALAPAALGAASARVAVVDSQTGVINLWSPADETSAPAGGSRPMAGTEAVPVIDAIRSGVPIIIDSSAEFARRYPHLTNDARTAHIRALICAPLRLPSNEVIGAVSLTWPRDHHVDDAARAVFDTIAELCARALERTQLQELEHSLVHAIAQMSVPVSVGAARVEVAARYRPALSRLAMGGDWYDVIAVDDHRVRIVVGDVVGHGIDAAANMAQLRTIIATLVRLDDDVDRLFPAVHPLLGSGSRREFRGTALCAEIDTARHRLRVTAAGHFPPIIWRPDQPNTVDATASRFPPLGMPARPSAPMEAAAFAPGSVLVAFSDGLVERRDEAIDVGLDRCRRVLDACAHRSVEEIADELLAMAMHTADPGSDDIALIVARSNATVAPGTPG